MLFIGHPLSNDSQVITHSGLALAQLEAFEAEWGKRYPTIGQAWRRAWEHVVPFFAFPPAVRKMIYTTNAVEPQSQLAQNYQNPRQFPDRRGGIETAVPGDPQRRRPLAPAD
jgi:transposase-like protein